MLALGEVEAFIPEGVLVECVYVLLKFYQVPRSEIAQSLENILNYKGIINDNRTILIKGLPLFQEKNVGIKESRMSRRNGSLPNPGRQAAYEMLVNKKGRPEFFGSPWQVREVT